MEKKFGQNTVLFLFASSIFLSACSDGDDGVTTVVSNTNFEAAGTFSLEVPVVNHTKFSLIGIDGEIDTDGDAGAGSVKITGVKRVLSESVADAEAHLQDLNVDVQDLVTEIRVETIQPTSTGGRSYIVNYTVDLPDFMEDHVTNTNGIITLDSISNDVTVINLNGSVAITNHNGSASVNLLNGKIEGLVTLPLNGVVDMTTLNGDIEVAIPVNTSAIVSANVTVGTVTAQDLTLQNGKSTPTFLSGTLGSGQGAIQLEAQQIGNNGKTG